MDNNLDLLTEIPHAPDAEAAFLAATIENPQRFRNIVLEQDIQPSLFYDKANAELMGFIIRRFKESEPIDPASLKVDIRNYKPANLRFKTLHDITLVEHDADGYEGYLAALRNTRAKRIVLQAATESIDMADQDFFGVIKRATEQAQEVLQGSAEMYNAKRAIEKFTKVLQDRYQNEGTAGLSTGIPQIDSHTGGMRKGELWVIGAKTSGGKSVLMLQMAAQAILDGKKVAIFSLELGVDEVVARIIAYIGRLSMSKLMNPRQMVKQDFDKIKHFAGILEQTGFSVCDMADLTIDQISGHCQRLQETNGLDLVIIDYVQMVTARRVKGQSREQEVAGISRACKQLAKKVKCPVLTATQLNEEGKSRESRAIEHDADNVLFIEDKENDSTYVRFWKCRNGERGTAFKAILEGETQRFTFF